MARDRKDSLAVLKSLTPCYFCLFACRNETQRGHTEAKIGQKPTHPLFQLAGVSAGAEVQAKPVPEQFGRRRTGKLPQPF